MKTKILNALEKAPIVSARKGTIYTYLMILLYEGLVTVEKNRNYATFWRKNG